MALRRAEVRDFLRPVEEGVRTQFRQGEKVEDKILFLREIQIAVPSLGEYPDQHAYMEGYVRCTAARRHGYDYKADPERQATCSGYVPIGGDMSQTATIREVFLELGSSQAPLELQASTTNPKTP